MKRLFQRSPRSRGSALSLAALAPMVDLLTILIVVVLRTYSTDPPLQIEGEPGFQLPQSIEEQPTSRGVTIDIAETGIYVEGWFAVSITAIKDDDIMILPLQDALNRSRGQRQRALIRADEDAPWSVVGKVLYTAQSSGYKDIDLIAESRASL